MEQIGTWLWEVVVPGLESLALAAAFQLARVYIARMKHEAVREILRELVRAAEQKFGVGAGEEKLKYVVEQADLRGLPVDEASIEAMVNTEFPKYVLQVEEPCDFGAGE
jgi:hypothetical protein